MPNPDLHRVSFNIDRSTFIAIRDLAGPDHGAFTEWIRDAIDAKLATIGQAELDDLTAEYRERMDAHRRRIAADGGPYLVPADNDRHYDARRSGDR